MKKFKNLSKKIGLKNDQLGSNLLILTTLLLLATLIVMLFSIFILQSTLTNTYLVQKDKQERFYFWMEKVEEYPNSPDVLYNAAVSANEISKKETAIKLLNNALLFDPQFKKAQDLRTEIISEAR